MYFVNVWNDYLITNALSGVFGLQNKSYSYTVVFIFLGFISTKPFKKSVQSADSPMYAVDCEMVCLQDSTCTCNIYRFSQVSAL